MNDVRLGVIEEKFAGVIWEKEPVASGELVKICADVFEWKKSTTYTVLKKLCEKGIFQNSDGIVKSLISKEEYYSIQSTRFVDETFSGSLPAFIAAFTSDKKLTKDEIDKIQAMIDKFRREELK